MDWGRDAPAAQLVDIALHPADGFFVEHDKFARAQLIEADAAAVGDGGEHIVVAGGVGIDAGQEVHTQPLAELRQDPPERAPLAHWRHHRRGNCVAR